MPTLNRYCLFVCFFVASSIVNAASITPNRIFVNLAEGQSTTIERTVTLDTTGPAAGKVDVFFLSDNTGSMGGAIRSVRDNATAILQALAGDDPRFAGIDVAFGVGSYLGDPREYSAAADTTSVAQLAYRLHQPMTESIDDVITGLGRWSARGGGDAPEANFFALQQAATEGAVTDGVGTSDRGFSSNHVTGWRTDAVRVIVWFGDVSSHTTTVSQAEAIQALNDNNIIVAAINTRSANSGIDTAQQASQIVAATNGTLSNNIVGSATTVDAILRAVESATNTVNVSLETRGDTAGLTISFSCVSPQGCNDVGAGESRLFAMNITGDSVGNYAFDTIAPGLSGAIANDEVTVHSCVNNLAARAKRSKVQLTWSDTGADHYIVLRATNTGGPYTEIAQTQSRYSTYLDTDVINNTRYYYIVREADASGAIACESIETSALPRARGRDDGSLPNLPPVINSTAIVDATEGVEYRYEVIANDPDIGDVLTYSLAVAPSGMSIDAATGVIQWVPQNVHVGQQSVIVQVSDTEGLMASQLFSVTVANINTAPTILSTPLVSARVNEAYQYAVNAIDRDRDDVLTFSLASAPSGMSIDSATGVITWVPSLGQAGDQPVIVSVSDLAGLQDTQSFSVAVQDANDAPQITSTPIVQATVNQLYQYAVIASDPDVGDVLSYSLLSAPAGMSIDSNTGLISWSPTSAQLGAHPVQIQVEDGGGLVASQNLSIDVLPDNRTPVINSTPVVVATESEAYSYAVIATDADGDTLIFSLVTGPEGMVIDATSGVIQWTPSSLQIGNQSIQVKVADTRGAEAVQSFAVVVGAFVPPNQPPVITSAPVINAVEAQLYQYLLQATDADADSLVFALTIAPAGMVIDAVSGLLSWTPATAQIGSHSVQAQVSDGNGGVVTQDFSITVAAANRLPSITSTPLTQAIEGQSYRYSVSATDPDNDTLVYTLVSAPAGMIIDASSGAIAWVPIDTQVGLHAITVSVDDSNGGVVQQNFSIDVTAEVTNQPPVITSAPLGRVEEEALYTYAVSASDPNGDVLTYSLDIAPVGMAINAATGVIVWTPSNTQIGIANVSVRVDDGNGRFVTQNFTITVTEKPAENQAPTITTIPITNAEVNALYSYGVNATDADGDTLGFSLTTAPSGMAINAVTGVINWTPLASQMGSVNVVVQVDDGNEGIATQSFSIAVVDNTTVNEPPVITSTPVTRAVVAEAYQYAVLANDANGDSLVYSLASAPTGMTINANSGVINWVADATQLPTQAVSVRVSDGQSFVQQNFVVTVSDVAAPLEVFVQASPSVINEGDSTTITLSTVGGTGDIITSLTVNGVVTPLNSANQVVVPGSAIGGVEIIASATDSIETISARTFFSVRDASDDTAPIAEILSPAAGSEITAPINIIGNASDANLVNYRLLVSPAGANTFTEINSGQSSVNNDVVGQFDPSMLANGQYQVLLIALDTNGQESSQVVTYQVTGDLKVGNFSFTVEDLNIPTAGIPVGVRRTYDSRQRSQRKDFGFGWSLDIQTGQIQESRDLGIGWVQQREGGGFFPPYCVSPIGDAPLVTVTLPDGNVESFEAAIEPRCNPLIPRFVFTMVLKPVGDTRSRLSVAGASGLRLNGSSFLDSSLLEDFDPERYTLTRDDGTVIQLHKRFGVENIQEANGNSIAFSNSGIIHSSGLSVTFDRDAQNRITQITDPKGQRIQYTYNSLGDLAAVTNRESEVTRYQYNRSHGLLEIIDPTGVRVTRNIYDDDGRLVAIVDADGNRVDITIDVAGRQQIVTDRLGNQTIYVYDDNGNVLSETNSLGETITRTYNARGELLTQVDALGNTSSFTYDTNGNQLTDTNALGETRTFAYNASGLLLTETDDAGNVVEINTYDGNNNLLTTTDASGNTTSNTYDAQGNLTRTIDPLGNTKTREYDTQGNLVREVNERGVGQTFSFDSNNNITQTQTTQTAADGTSQVVVTRFEYDGENRVVNEVDSLGNEIATQYDANGRETRLSDSAGRVTESVYNASGKLVETRHPDGSVERFEYDAEGNLIAEIDRQGRRTSLEYDAANRRIRTINPDGTSTRTQYNATGHIAAIIDEAGSRTEFSYDAVGRRISETDAAGNVKTFVYDNRGFMTSLTNERGDTTLFEYDNQGRRTRVVFADGNEEVFIYDALGRRVAHTDQLGNTTAFDYDAVGNLAAITDAMGNVTAYTYNESNNLTAITDSNGNTTTMSYDIGGRLINRTLPSGDVESLTYDIAGNIQSRVDANSDAISFEYDDTGRILRIIYPGGDQTAFTYTAAGQRLSATDASGTTTYGYDSRDRMISIDYPNGLGLRYAYDIAGNRTQVRIVGVGSSERVTQYRYNALNLPVSVTDADGLVTTYRYDNSGNQIGITYPNGVVTDIVYDTLNRIIAIETRDILDTVVSRFDYVLNAKGQRVQATENGRVVNYVYNVSGQLLEERVIDPVFGVRTSLFSYDSVGNRLTKSVNGTITDYTYDASNRVISETTAGVVTDYTYDANGNMLSAQSPTEDFTFSYDVDNRLVLASTPSTTVAYRYDVDGIRQSQTINGVTTTYLTDPNRNYAQVLMELDSAQAVHVEYTYGTDLISQQRSSDTRYYQYDSLGSTRQLTDASGAVTDAYTYTAFGQTEQSTGGAINNYLFSGEQFDPALQKYYLRARYLDTSVGRFISADPFSGSIADPMSLHKYQYANNDPINNIDPTGNFTLAGVSISLNIRVSLGAIALPSFQFAIRRAITGVLSVAKSGARIVVREVRQCIRTPRRCRIDSPLLSTGSGIPQTAQHILDAQLGRGSNLVPAPALLSRRDRRGTSRSARTWYNRTSECNRAARTAYRASNGGTGGCDEYPYFSSFPGGPAYHPGTVSLRLISNSESSPQGRQINSFYNSCRVRRTGPRRQRLFLAFGIPQLPNFQWCGFGRR